MDANLDKIALDLYGKIQNRFPNIKIGDEHGEVLSKKQDIPRARFFEFEYEEDGEPLGTIAINLDQDDGVVVQISGDLVNDNDNSNHHGAFKFIRSFKQFAKNRLLNFKIENTGKSGLDKRDYSFIAKRKELPVMPIAQPVMESKFYGTNRISYQDLGEARLIIKHSQPINPEFAAGRTMHIENIYVENAVGERFRYPYKHINGARALAEHVKAGGNPYDSIGQHITGLSEELAGLRKFKNYVGRQEQLSEAMSSVTGRVLERIEEIKKEVTSLQRESYYKMFAESFTVKDEQVLPEELVNDLIDRLTIRTFNEELKSVFPYIAKFVDESELPILEVGVDDLLSELSKNTLKSYKGKAEKDADEHEKAGYAYDSDPDERDFAPSAFKKAEQRRAGAKRAGEKIEKQLDERATPEWLANVERAKVLLSKGMTPEQVGKQLGAQGPNNGMTGTMGGTWGAINYAQQQLKQSKPTFESPEDQFENFMDSIISEDKDEIFSPNKDAKNVAIQKLNKIMSQELKGGPDGVNAVGSLKGLIDNPEFLLSLRDIDADLDVRPLIQQFILQQDPEVASQLQFGGEGEQEMPPAPEAPPAPMAAPAPEAPPAPMAAPVAEDNNDVPFDGPYKKNSGTVTDKGGAKHGAHSQAKHLAHQGLMKAVQNAKKAGAKLDTKMKVGGKSMTLYDAIIECGLTPMECGFNDPKTDSNESGLEQMTKFISGFWNKEQKNFTIGGTRAKTKIIKGFKDGEFSNASEDDVRQIVAMIDKMDPSSHEHMHIMKLAGVPGHSQIEQEQMQVPDFGAHAHTISNKMSESSARDSMKTLLEKINFGK